jgi:hypothetical protein
MKVEGKVRVKNYGEVRWQKFEKEAKACHFLRLENSNSEYSGLSCEEGGEGQNARYEEPSLVLVRTAKVPSQLTSHRRFSPSLSETISRGSVPYLNRLSQPYEFAKFLTSTWMLRPKTDIRQLQNFSNVDILAN